MPRKTLPANVVGPQIRDARKKLGLTQDEFAGGCQLAGLDISRSTLGQIEARLRFVSDEELIVLASLLGVVTDELFPRELTRRLRGKKLKAVRKKSKNK
jgi:transcriptional regulator with XRE-family HTH domain